MWKGGVAKRLPATPLYEVDAHNVVPVWVASDKQEVGARTIRKKINDKLPTWLVDIPPLEPLPLSGPVEQVASLPKAISEEALSALTVQLSEPSTAEAALLELEGAQITKPLLAATGAGKTLAYLAPVFQHVAESASGLILPLTIAVVLAPTRELAIQIVSR